MLFLVIDEIINVMFQPLTAPRRVELNEHVLLALGDQLVKVLGHSNLDVLALVVGDVLALDVLLGGAGGVGL